MCTQGVVNVVQIGTAAPPATTHNRCAASSASGIPLAQHVQTIEAKLANSLTCISGSPAVLKQQLLAAPDHSGRKTANSGLQAAPIVRPAPAACKR
jgi:hypothetical protein